MPSSQIQPHLLRAASVRILTEIVRHHAAQIQLRFYEDHPSDGMHDNLSLYASAGTDGSKDHHLLNLNMNHGLVAVIHPWDNPRVKDSTSEPYYYLEPYLLDRSQAIRHVEDLVGLPSEHPQPLPPTTPATLCYRLFASLLERNALTVRPLDMRSGWYASSGWEGNGVRSELSVFTEPERLLKCTAPEEEARAAVARKYWLLMAPKRDDEAAPEALAAFDLEGHAYFRPKPSETWNVWDKYKKCRRKLASLIKELEARINR